MDSDRTFLFRIQLSLYLKNKVSEFFWRFKMSFFTTNVEIFNHLKFPEVKGRVQSSDPGFLCRSGHPSPFILDQWEASRDSRVVKRSLIGRSKRIWDPGANQKIWKGFAYYYGCRSLVRLFWNHCLTKIHLNYPRACACMGKVLNVIQSFYKTDFPPVF